jgi:putative ABC transport system permease protein
VPEGAKLRRGWKWDAVAGRPLYLAGSSAILLGSGLGRLLECQPTSDRSYLGPNGLPIAEERPLRCRRPRAQLMSRTDKGQINAVEAEIAGTFDGGQAEMDRAWIHVPLPLAQQLMATRKVSYYAVELRDKAQAVAFGKEVREAAAARGIALEAVPWEEHWVGDDWRLGMQILGAFRSLMALVVVVIAGMAVFTTMVKSVSERTREIGTLRSIGFTRRQIVTLFAVEAGLLTVIASALGLLVTLVVTHGLTAAGLTYNAGVMAEPIRLGIAYVPATYLSTAAYLAVLAGIAGLLPARRAARRPIPDALAFA